MFERIFNKLKHKNTRENDFFEIGFHGDLYAIKLVDYLISTGVDIFIETGTNVGSTLSYVAKKHPLINCLSCEPDKIVFEFAKSNTKELSNIEIFNLMSQDFFKELNNKNLFHKKTLFWLDAHGYGFKWPLKDEIEFITQRFESGFILIDDFKVPGADHFLYDQYQGQICSYDYVKDALNPKLAYQLYYPTYKDKTSQHHPLCGWGLLVFGNNDFSLPVQLQNKMAKKL